MGRWMELPEEAYEWMTPEIEGLLAGIQGAHAAKKRSTIIKIAWALANEQPLEELWGLEDVCSESVWYRKWKQQPLVQVALERCYQRALGWRDERTAALEAWHGSRRRRSVAEYAASAPAALAAVMSDQGQKGADRISAADTLMRWAEPETAERIGQAGAAVRVDASFEKALERVYGNTSDGEIHDQE